MRGLPTIQDSEALLATFSNIFTKMYPQRQHKLEINILQETITLRLNTITTVKMKSIIITLKIGYYPNNHSYFILTETTLDMYFSTRYP